MKKSADSAKIPNPEAVKLRLASLCARSEQCVSDLRRKCLQAGLTASQAESVLQFLREQKFVDDARFARAFAGDKVRFAGWGMNKIRLALRQKRIGNTEIEDALSSVPKKDYSDALKRVANQKARSLDMSTQEGKAKFYKYMVSRGFESNLVSQLLSHLRNSE